MHYYPFLQWQNIFIYDNCWTFLVFIHEATMKRETEVLGIIPRSIEAQGMTHILWYHNLLDGFSIHPCFYTPELQVTEGFVKHSHSVFLFYGRMTSLLGIFYHDLYSLGFIVESQIDYQPLPSCVHLLITFYLAPSQQVPVYVSII